MAIATLLFMAGIALNLFMLAQQRKALPRFAKTCAGCGCQAPPMEYPPAVHECPICQWLEQHQQRLAQRSGIKVGDRLQ